MLYGEEKEREMDRVHDSRAGHSHKANKSWQRRKRATQKSYRHASRKALRDVSQAPDQDYSEVKRKKLNKSRGLTLRQKLAKQEYFVVLNYARKILSNPHLSFEEKAEQFLPVVDHLLKENSDLAHRVIEDWLRRIKDQRLAFWQNWFFPRFSEGYPELVERFEGFVNVGTDRLLPLHQQTDPSSLT